MKKHRIAVEPEVAESSRKRCKGTSAAIIVDSDSDSLQVPFPNPCDHCIHGDQCHVARQSCSFLRKSKRSRVKTPPSESESVGVKGEMRELRFVIEELTEQVRALVRQGRRDREGREGHCEDRKGKGRRQETPPTTDHYTLE
ncbi:hypothetical protein GGU11DRAFT_761424 [Lentinula aff. detonsa]|nr:hypothetical protein GGU11DRAFT_761424 [Lentinula aff. detonsa]